MMMANHPQRNQKYNKMGPTNKQTNNNGLDNAVLLVLGSGKVIWLWPLVLKATLLATVDVEVATCSKQTTHSLLPVSVVLAVPRPVAGLFAINGIWHLVYQI